MDRRYFFKALASGLVAACAPELFLPKVIKPQWRVLRFYDANNLGTLTGALVLQRTLPYFKNEFPQFIWYRANFTREQIESRWSE